jgi:hypothetical protein
MSYFQQFHKFFALTNHWWKEFLRSLSWQKGIKYICRTLMEHNLEISALCNGGNTSFVSSFCILMVCLRSITKNDLRKIGWGGMDCIHLAQDRDQWKGLAYTVMNLWIL